MKFVLMLKRAVSPFRRRNIQRLKQSDLFDREWYLEKYPLGVFKTAPEVHYLLHGKNGTHDPGPNFSSAKYLERNPEVKASKVNPLLHYLRVGKKMGLSVVVEDVVPKNIPNKVGGSRASLYKNYRALRDSLQYVKAESLLVGAEQDYADSAYYWRVRAEAASHRGAYDQAIEYVEKSIGLEATADGYRECVAYKKKKGMLFGSIDEDFRRYIELTDQKAEAFYQYFSHIWEREPVSESLMGEMRTATDYLLKAVDGALKKDKSIGKLLMLQASMLASYGAVSAAKKTYDHAKKVGGQDATFVYLKYILQKSRRGGYLDDHYYGLFERVVSGQGKLRRLIAESGGSISIVGNAPSLLGSGAGGRIDSARLVIRFNDYSTDYPYCHDVGKRTDVWVRMPFHPYVKREVESRCKAVVFAGSNRMQRPSSIMYDVLDFAAQGRHVDFFEPAVFYELQKELGCPPTAGLYVCYLAFKVLGPLRKGQYFGFSFDEQMSVSAEGGYHISDSSAASSSRHAWEREYEFFKKLKQGEKNGNDSSLGLSKVYDTVISTSPGLVEYSIFGKFPVYVSSQKVESYLEFMSTGGKGGRPIKELADLNGRVCVVGFGRAKTGGAAIELANALGCDFWLAEYGLISSMHLPSEKKFNFSLILDDRGIFYDTTRPSMIEELLYSDTRIFDPGVQQRARNAIEHVVENNITKYNNSPNAVLPTRGERSRILVIDQTANDNSILCGQCEKYRFVDMLEYALAQDADVFVKTHPETAAGAKGGNMGDLDRYRDNERLTIINDQCNIVSLIKQVDEVYVMTSGVGLEALLAGKKVRCFGVPFYSGWGLTADMVNIPNKRRPITVESLFAAVFFFYTKFYHPETRVECELEDCLSWIDENRAVMESLVIEQAESSLG
ncbi:glycosyltransferase family 29 protein [Stutzerimonas stutzeri]|uniref:glycosyltransferase family 29 protein n=1 Tax=Stutzerimonas stutzeri TaxID=316 RepID=UPI0009BE1125|nr:glycosyltransferase family 29 protein [Stutzerimonas stutzeri]